MRSDSPSSWSTMLIQTRATELRVLGIDRKLSRDGLDWIVPNRIESGWRLPGTQQLRLSCSQPLNPCGCIHWTADRNWDGGTGLSGRCQLNPDWRITTNYFTPRAWHFACAVSINAPPSLWNRSVAGPEPERTLSTSWWRYHYRWWEENIQSYVGSRALNCSHGGLRRWTYYQPGVCDYRWNFRFPRWP